MNKSEFSKRFGFCLAYYIDKRGMKKKHLAKEVGITSEHLSRLLKGQTDPSFFTVYRMADVLGVTVNDFVVEKTKQV